MKRLAYILFSLSLMWIGSSCSSTGCTENRSATPLAGFYSNQADAKIIIDSLQIWGIDAPLHSYLVDFDQKESQSYLPLRPEYDWTGFVFRYGQGLLDQEKYQDTVIFYYTATPRFVSAECGAMFFYNIDRMYYSRHLVDSIAILDSLITNADIERIKIFFKTQSEEDDSHGNSGQRPTSVDRSLETHVSSSSSLTSFSSSRSLSSSSSFNGLTSSSSASTSSGQLSSWVESGQREKTMSSKVLQPKAYNNYKTLNQK